MDPRFVGRASELGELVSLLDDALAGRAGLALVAGEPGIGKSRLVGELCRLAGTRAVPTLRGGCTDEDGAPAYWPWRRILRSWLAGAGPEGAAAAQVGELLRIAPELQRIGGVEQVAPPAAGPDGRFALFDAATQFFCALAADTALVVVLDDVQWADPASLHLLAHLAREAPAARLLLAATYRPAELAADPARAGVVAGLARLPGSVHLQLTGLTETEVAAALTDRLGAAAPGEVVAAVARRTGGNPFFVGELGRLLRADPGGSLHVPVAVRDVVRRRIGRLPAGCRAVLDVAAVLGREIDTGLVSSVADLPADRVLDELRPALDDGVIEQPRGRDGLRFSHDLVREALLAELAPGQRAQVHARVVTVLQGSAGDPDVLPELARHALAALPCGDRRAAVSWARAAAGLALARLTYEDAAWLLSRAVEAGRAVLAPAERVELLLATADAQHPHDVAAAIASCTAAAELARHTGDARGLGRAALALPAISELPWLDLVRGWCEEALTALGPADDPLRAQLLAQLAHCLLLVPDHEGMAARSAQALAMAERLDDPPSLARALRARQLARSGTDGTAERLVLGGRLLALAARSGDPADALWGHLWRFDALLQSGRVADAEAELDRLDPLVARLRQPMARLQLLRGRVALAIGRGRFAEATEINEETVAIAERCGNRGAAATARSLRFTLTRFTGSDPGGDLSWFFDTPLLGAPFTALTRALYALQLLVSGEVDDARRWYAGLPEPGSPRIPPFMALVLEVFRAELATDLGDIATAQASHRLLLPHAELHAVGGAGAITTGGSVQLFLGIAALGAGKPDAAIRHLRPAITVDDAAGLAAFAAMARFRLAAALRARGAAGDLDEAVAVAAEADVVAQRLGMAPLRVRIAGLVTSLRDGGVLTRRETEIAGLVGRGLTNKQVGAALHVSERTVESHVQHILAKLGFTRRSQIAAWVARRGQ